MSDLKGDLAVFEPISVMQMLNLAEATGELKLARRGNSARVYFEKGNVTFAGITNRPVKLGEYLVREGLIDEEALNDALGKLASAKKRIGALLIEAGHIDEAMLTRAVMEQVKEVIFEIVRWKEGTFSFDKDKEPAPQEVRIDIPLDHLMLEGLKRLDEERDDTP
jgi:hypothetical protein